MNVLTHRRLVSAVALTSVALAVLIVQGLAQQAPTFRTRTDIVELDVSVLDKDRRPVRGLTAADFVVLEDGKPQQVSIFEAIDVPDPEPPPVAWMRDVTPDVETNDRTVTRLWVLVIDDALIPTDPYAITTSVKVVREIVARFGPNDLAAVVFTTDSRKAQDFTNDRSRLLATLELFNPGWAGWAPRPKGVPNNPDWQFQTGAVLTLRNVMSTLATLPHHRKAVIWVSGGVSFALDSELLASADGPKQALASLRRTLQVTDEMLSIARSANVPIYPIHPCGLVAPGATDRCGAAAAGMKFLADTASETNGRVIMNTNDYGPGITNIFEENRSYYMLGYSPTNAKADGTFRRLEVKVNRPGVEVRARSSYNAPKRRESPPKDAREALARATAVPIAVAELPLRATASPFATPGSRNAAVAIALGVRQRLAPDALTDRVSVKTDLRISAFTTEGRDKGTQHSTVTVSLRADAQVDTDFEALARMDLPPGRFRLRVAAHQAGTAKTGTVMVDVDVPDFNKEPASMSGVMIGATPGQPSAPRELLSPILPVVPTSQRDFRADERAMAFFYLYQPAPLPPESAHLAIRIVDGRGATVASDTATIDAARFVVSRGLRAVPYQYEVPIDRLQPGPYLLTFESVVGVTTVRRDVRFSVK